MEFDFYYVLAILLVDIHGLFLSQSKKSFTITDAFQNILDECRRHVAKSKECKLNQIWVDKGS